MVGLHSCNTLLVIINKLLNIDKKCKRAKQLITIVENCYAIANNVHQYF